MINKASTKIDVPNRKRTGISAILNYESKISLQCVLSNAFGLTLEALRLNEILILLLCMVWSLTGGLGALAQSWFIDAAVGIVMNPAQKKLWSVCLPLGIILSIEVGSLVIKALEDGKITIFWSKISQWCEEKLIVKASCMEYANFGDQGTVNRLTRANNEFAGRIRHVMENVFRFISGLVGVLGILMILVGFAWYIPLILLAGGLPAALFYRTQTKEAYESAVHSTGSTRRVWYYLTLLTTREGMKEIRFGGIHNYLVGRHDACADEVSAIRIKVLKRQAVYGVLGLILRYCSVLAVLITTVLLILHGKANIGALALVLASSVIFQGSFASAVNALADIKDSGRYFQDYLEVMKLSDEGCHHPASIGVIDLPREADIECHNLSFTYPGNTEATLKEINLHIAQGERIAIVGENGSGKSTFISLLCGLYSPQAGCLTIAGKEAKAHRAFIRQLVSVALQESQHYEMDVASNIALGNPYRPLNQMDIELAAKTIGIHDVIKTWSKGYKTHIGNLVEGGRWLSGGEWQKVVLARTLVKDQARIMILDEPTASLDPQSEADLYRSYGKITGARTSILVSHRLGSCKLADRILVFHNGRIVEDGSHQMLMEKKGQYFRMFNAQASWYN